MSFLNQSAFSARLLLISTLLMYVWVFFLIYLFIYFFEVNLNDLTGWCLLNTEPQHPTCCKMSLLWLCL